MDKIDLIRAVYHRLRKVPLLGVLLEAIRYRSFPWQSTAATRYAGQQALLEAHGYALAGLRRAIQAQAGLRHAIQAQAATQEALQAEVFKQAHHLNQRLDGQRLALEQRIEFQRQETLFELRYANPAATPNAGAATPEPRILNAEKLQQQRQQNAIRLNVGCGHKPDTGRLNVDLRELPGVDLIAAADQLPFGLSEVQEIYAAHLLEHFPIEQLRRSLLPAWIQKLAPGGEIRAIVPDAQAMLAAYASGDVDFPTLRLILFGGQEYAGDFHHTMFTPDSLAELFTEQGLVKVRIDARGRRNGLCLECEVVGVKA